ncbi:helix-turn-helix transcriptional regulator [Spirosoma aureum]|uniref:Helix-turn-helix transcriptional regulator n=1 Tax=Spirosoma aureum TaxID=2692134 RepID=A0A6G9AL22_9BACT|nr:helix-turn-helix transcriptional regulator [Spirosoma aureum]QIP12985.1 helix-turn-helix transcriptional regulator [Spirosoma aureum]
MELSEHIKALRESKRIKLSEMATALGVDVSNYAKIEKKGKKLTLERIEEIASALGVSTPELLGYGSSETSERVKELEKMNAELKERLREVIGVRADLKSFEQKYDHLYTQFKLYEEMTIQKKENDKKVKLFAREVLASSGEKETQENLIRFIKAFFLEDEI